MIHFNIQKFDDIKKDCKFFNVKLEKLLQLHMNLLKVL